MRSAELGKVGIVGEERADLQLHAARLELRQPALANGSLLAAEEHELHEQVAVRVGEIIRLERAGSRS